MGNSISKGGVCAEIGGVRSLPSGVGRFLSYHPQVSCDLDEFYREAGDYTGKDGLRSQSPTANKNAITRSIASKSVAKSYSRSFAGPLSV